MLEFGWSFKYNDLREPEARRDLLVSDMGDISDLSVMDLGANVGFFSFALADRGARVTAVEPPDNNKDLFHPGVTEHRVMVGGPEDLPSGPFHYALVMSVLHHMPRWREILDGVLERTEVTAYVEVPNPKERHPAWHGSLESHRMLTGNPRAEVIGSHYEVTHRLKRDLWAVRLG